MFIIYSIYLFLLVLYYNIHIFILLHVSHFILLLLVFSITWTTPSSSWRVIAKPENPTELVNSSNMRRHLEKEKKVTPTTKLRVLLQTSNDPALCLIIGIQQRGGLV